MSLVFWILMLIWFVFDGYFPRTLSNTFMFILLLLIGWQIFGNPLK